MTTTTELGYSFSAVQQSILLIETLKRYLRHQGITYKSLADKIGQSESNVKRIFSEQSISLGALEEMCNAAGIELLELAKMSRTQREEVESFTLPQEEALATNAKLFAFAYLVLGGMAVAKIQTRYEFSAPESQKLLLLLDKLGIIRLHPKNRVEPLLSKNVRWLDNGPLNGTYTEEIKKEFLRSSFAGANEQIRFLNAQLSPHSLQVLAARLNRLIAEFTSLAELDEIGKNEGTENVWLLLAYRPWTFSVVNRYLRTKSR